MKKQDIRNIYIQKVTELLNQRYTIFPDTMGGSQGEIAHIDLTDGSQIIRVLLERSTHWERCDNGYIGDSIRLTVGKARSDTWVGDRWDGTVWNNHIEPSFQIEWAWITDRTRGDWYTTWTRPGAFQLSGGSATRHSIRKRSRCSATLSNRRRSAGSGNSRV